VHPSVTKNKGPTPAGRSDKDQPKRRGSPLNERRRVGFEAESVETQRPAKRLQLACRCGARAASP
jgi:hypothetical protein